MEINKDYYGELNNEQAYIVWGIALTMIVWSFFNFTVLKISMLIVMVTAVILTIMGR